ncbi:hypothetical protein [Streptomyces sp. NPDC055287]
MDSDRAWERLGSWIPSDSAPHAVRQARAYLTEKMRVHALWAGPAGSWEEPRWVCVEISEVNAHSTGPRDVPWLRVWDGWSLFGLTLSDIAMVRRAEADDELILVFPRG